MILILRPKGRGIVGDVVRGADDDVVGDLPELEPFARWGVSGSL